MEQFAKLRNQSSRALFWLPGSRMSHPGLRSYINECGVYTPTDRQRPLTPKTGDFSVRVISFSGLGSGPPLTTDLLLHLQLWAQVIRAI